MQDDEMAEVEPIILNGSRGLEKSRPARVASVRNGPPPYLPASKGILNRGFSFAQEKKG
jgi:hypothetical protein